MRKQVRIGACPTRTKPKIIKVTLASPNPDPSPDLYLLSTASMACATPSTCASVPRIPATEKPTGASPGAWHGSEAAQPSRALTWLGSGFGVRG